MCFDNLFNSGCIWIKCNTCVSSNHHFPCSETSSFWDQTKIIMIKAKCKENNKKLEFTWYRLNVSDNQKIFLFQRHFVIPNSVACVYIFSSPLLWYKPIFFSNKCYTAVSRSLVLRKRKKQYQMLFWLVIDHRCLM